MTEQWVFESIAQGIHNIATTLGYFAGAFVTLVILWIILKD